MIAEMSLKMIYGAEECQWWRKIPLTVRQKCQEKRENDPTPAEPFTYTDFIDLQDIYKKEWDLLSKTFPKPFKIRNEFLKNIGKMNYIRNKVMHPVKDPPTIDDFLFVREFFKEFTGEFIRRDEINKLDISEQ